ncbi:hypothetical protein HanRHA438_Chr09g0424631 [Helianthus annuus]|nr:hypothetical protein HanRHA438_Chr09g0424631 [Helianthus annuus]KAJ0895258.1 hypothetical protein HanPSC8_Chr09g0398391 [Helianthus annuus]
MKILTVAILLFFYEIIVEVVVISSMLGFEALSGYDGGLPLGVATMLAAVAALSHVLLVPAMMKCHSEPFTLCDN